MSLNLPKPPPKYDPQDEANARRAIEQADKQNVKQSQIFGKILMRDTATGEVRTIVMTSGALVIS